MTLDRFSTILRAHGKAELTLTKELMAQCNNKSRRVYKLFCRMEAQSHALFPLFFKKGVDCIIHSKIIF